MPILTDEQREKLVREWFRGRDFDLGEIIALIEDVERAVLEQVAQMMYDDSEQSIETIAWADRLRQMAKGGQSEI